MVAVPGSKFHVPGIITTIFHYVLPSEGLGQRLEKGSDTRRDGYKLEVVSSKLLVDRN